MASLLFDGVPLVQAHNYHVDDLTRTNRLHADKIFMAERRHQLEMKWSCLLHKRTLALARELHYSHMAHDMEFARREAIRDVMEQRAKREYTLMVVDTIIFTSAFAMVSEGTLAPNADPVSSGIYAFLCGVSVYCALLQLLFALTLCSRMGKYDIHNPGRLYTCRSTHSTFGEYFECHCRVLARGSVFMFYGACVTELAALGVHAFDKFYYDYFNPIAAAMFPSIILIPILLILLGEKVWPSDTREGKEGVGVPGEEGPAVPVRDVLPPDESDEFHDDVTDPSKSVEAFMDEYGLPRRGPDEEEIGSA